MVNSLRISLDTSSEEVIPDDVTFELVELASARVMVMVYVFFVKTIEIDGKQ